MNTLGRGIEVGLRNPQATQMMDPTQQEAQRKAAGPNLSMIDDVMNKSYQQIDGQTMDIYQQWGDIQQMAKTMWNNFNIDVTNPDYGNPASIAASRSFYQSISKLKDKSNKFQRGGIFEGSQEQAGQRPGTIIERNPNEIATSQQTYNTSLTPYQERLYADLSSEEWTPTNMKKLQTNIDRELQREQDTLAYLQENGGNAQEIKEAEARIQQMEPWKAKLLTAGQRSTARADKAHTVSTRKWAIGNDTQGQYSPTNPNGVVSPGENTIGHLQGGEKYELSHTGLYNQGIYYRGFDGKGGKYDLASDDAVKLINSQYNHNTKEVIQESDLYDRGKSTLSLLPQPLQVYYEKVFPEYRRAVSKASTEIINQAKSGDWKFDQIGYKPGKWRLPYNWKIRKGEDNSDYYANETDYIKHIEFIPGEAYEKGASKEGSLKNKPHYRIHFSSLSGQHSPSSSVNRSMGMTDRYAGSEPDHFKEIYFTKEGKAEIEELIGFNMDLTQPNAEGQEEWVVNLDPYGFGQAKRYNIEQTGSYIHSDPNQSLVYDKNDWRSIDPNAPK